MTCLETNARLRDHSLFARWFAAIRAALRLRALPNPPLPKAISDRLARDIGMDANDLERLRFEWPSRSGRPRI